MNELDSINLRKQPQIGINTDQARKERVEFLNSFGHSTDSYLNSTLEADQVKSNIESFIGTMSIPVGLVGPLIYENEDKEIEQVFTAAATTEGALVASMNRGASVINQSGGFRTIIQKKKMLRAPMFCFDNINQAMEFEGWLQDQINAIREYIKQFSKRAELVEIKSNFMGRNLMTQFVYETGDASGQNMTTICTWNACLWLAKEYEKLRPGALKDYALDCNGSSDKKVTYDSMINGRGIDVTAECVIPEEILNDKLKVNSTDFLTWYNRCNLVGVTNGMIGNNANVANTIAAIFTATGQDIACVHESAVGYLYFEKHEKGLYASLRLPRLIVATVGGGTSLPGQSENLKLMGCYGANKVARFAELIAGFCLGLELSTTSAMASGQFAIAHERLGRNKPIEYLTSKDDLKSYLSENLLIDKNAKLSKIKELSEKNGLMTNLIAQNVNKYLGMSLWNVSKGEEATNALLKSKATDKEIINGLSRFISLVNPGLANTFASFAEQSDYNHSDEKELLIYDRVESAHIPKTYGTHRDESRETRLVLMEYIENVKVEWSPKMLMEVISSSTKIQRSLSVLNDISIFKFNNKENYLGFANQLLNFYNVEATDSFNKLLKKSVECIGKTDEMSLKTTLIHNDFNLSNLLINSDKQVFVIDFELSKTDVPQKDFVELMSNIFHIEDVQSNMDNILQFYRNELKSNLAFDYSDKEWAESMKYALSKFVVNKLSLYVLGDKVFKNKKLPFLIQNTLGLSSYLDNHFSE